MATALLRQLRRKLLLLILKVIKFYFDQFVVFERLIHRGKELRAESLLADLQCCLQALSLGFETADLSIRELHHCF